MAVGDFNAKHINWNCLNNNQNGKIIFNYSIRTPTSILAPTSYTLYPYNATAHPSIVDFALIKNIKNIQIEAINDLDSDNLSILLTLNDISTEIKEKKP